MNFVFRITLLTLALTITQNLNAGQMSASKCEIFIKGLSANLSSHGSGSLNIIVKTNWIGNEETIKKVGFFGQAENISLGNNQGSCNSSLESNDWKIYSPSTDFSGLNFGEYSFSLPIETGSVTSSCVGYTFSWKGVFFVETNKNTYWVNPEMNSNKNFVFDRKLYRSLIDKGGVFLSQGLSTLRDDLKGYNSLRCQ